MSKPFADRYEAGRVLAEKLSNYAERSDVVVLGLPRGGVPVAFEIARALGAPLDVFLVRKLGVPGHQELAMGAIASGGAVVLNDEAIEALGITPEEIDEAIERECRELERRERIYRRDRAAVDVADKIVIVADDGLATGSTMRAAVAALRTQKPAAIVVAAPTAALETCEAMGAVADECVCAITPTPFRAVGLWYENFEQTTDDEACALLKRAAEAAEGPA
ncbi:MAG: phosphoribosyltransferase [Paludisphaera borealis]|uniref:phosphoribosyltransferase n=1 Tax=Paludisphaera borealis TaxID=1387353 RepID=UPI002844A3BD|nr:phosphoribosyltransferase [Paludisphaera borealis]MDR3620707.1 phosphoribosyltransferase [Paludisphaera borealis]